MANVRFAQISAVYFLKDQGNKTQLWPNTQALITQDNDLWLVCVKFM